MNKAIIFIAVISLVFFGLMFLRSPQPSPEPAPTDPTTTTVHTQPSPGPEPPPDEPITLPAPPVEDPPILIDDPPPGPETVVGPGQTPPPPVTPGPRDDLLPEEDATPGKIDMAALFKEKMMDQVRTQTAAQHKIHYSGFSGKLTTGDNQRLQELLLQRRLGMVEAGMAAQVAGRQPDPTTMAAAYSAAEVDIQALLGEQYDAFVDYEMGMQDRIELNSIIAVFVSDKIELSPAQQDQLLALMQEERQANGLAIRWDSPDAMGLMQGDVPGVLSKHYAMYKAMDGRLDEIVDDRQTETLRNFFRTRLEHMTNALNGLPRQAPPQP